VTDARRLAASEAGFDRVAEVFASVDTVAVTFNEALRAVVDAVHDGVIDPERVAVGGRASVSTLGWPHRQRLASLADGEINLVANDDNGFRTLVTGRVDGRRRTARRHVPQMERHVWVVCDGDEVSTDGEISVDAVSEAAVRRAVDDAPDAVGEVFEAAGEAAGDWRSPHGMPVAALAAWGFTRAAEWARVEEWADTVGLADRGRVRELVETIEHEGLASLEVDDALPWVLRLAREVIDGRRDAGEVDPDRGGGSATPAD